MSGADEGLLAKTAGGAGWVIAFRMTTRILGLASTLTLVRLLGPGDFGLVALATSFAGAVDAFANLSPQEALVRERAPDRAMYDTGFTMSLLRGFLTAAIVAAAAPFAGQFFHEPRLGPVLLALAASAVIGGAENIAVADFMRTFAFATEFRFWTAPRVLQVITTVSVALMWHSYWALVIGILTGRIARTVLSYVMRPYWPRLTLVAWRRITGFTMWSWGIYVVQMLRDRMETVLIGRFFSPARVGLYALGGEIAALPATELVEPLCRAVFPSFSQLRHGGVGVAQTYLRLLAATATLVLPAGVGIAMVADPLVRVAFGEKWLEAIPVIQILGVGSTLAVFANISGTLFSAFAMLRTTFAVTIGGTAVRATLLAFLLPGGSLVTAALISICVGLGEQVVMVTTAMRRFHASPAALARALWRSVLAAAAMAAVLVESGLGMTAAPVAPWRHLLETSGLGAVVYAAALVLAWLAAGRPDGPERDLLTLAGRALSRLRAMRLPRPGRSGARAPAGRPR